MPFGGVGAPPCHIWRSGAPTASFGALVLQPRVFIGVLLCVACVAVGCNGGTEGRLDSADTTTTGANVEVAADPGDAAFCTKVAEVMARDRDAFTDPTGGTDPQAGLEQAKQIGLRLGPPMRELANAAPAALAPALDTLASGFEALAAGDFVTLSARSAQMGDAGQQFGDYIATRCQDVGGLEAVTDAFGTDP